MTQIKAMKAKRMRALDGKDWETRAPRKMSCAWIETSKGAPATDAGAP